MFGAQFVNCTEKITIMKRFISFLIGLTWSSFLFAQTTITMVVHEVPQNCQRMMPQQCLNVQIDGAKDWELFYDKIYGFEYVAGYRYVLSVIRTERPAPVPQDLSKYIYKLDKVVSQILVPLATGNTHFRVVRLNGKAPGSDELMVSLNADRTLLTCTLGCNTFSSPIAWNKRKTKLTILGGSTQLMECDSKTMETEKLFLSALNAKKFQLRNANDLWIWSSKKNEQLALELVNEVAETPQIINKPERTPMDYFNGKTLHVIYLNGQKLSPNAAAITFDKENGRFFGSNGCNKINGGFQLIENSFAFTSVVSTKMACIDEETQALERGIMHVLHTEKLKVDFAEHVINFYDETGKLVMMLAV